MRLSSLFFFAAIAVPRAQAPAPAARDPQATLRYIHASWDSLTRSATDCQAITDTKITVPPVLYLPRGFATPPAVATAAQRCHLQILTLPRTIAKLGDVRPRELPAPGLLYLPNPLRRSRRALQ